MDSKWWWLLGVAGPLGVMGLVRAALTFRNERRTSRAPQLTFASREQVEELAAAFVQFVPDVFGFAFDDCFISDESTLGHFATDAEELPDLRARIRSLYGIDVSSLPDDRLVTIVRAIAEPTK